MTDFRLDPAVADAFPGTLIVLVTATGLCGRESWPLTVDAVADLERSLADGSRRPADDTDPRIWPRSESRDRRQPVADLDGGLVADGEFVVSRRDASCLLQQADPAFDSRRSTAADPAAAAPSSESAATAPPAAATGHPSDLHVPFRDRNTALINTSNAT
ncbi:hypothetical protein [Streptomyces sp. NPDC093089]|uniref:hypothetical protein n=1 Tax=Streptomyces sp. NPDC093089 TaxID=3366024 RepID=UPI0038066B8C